MVLLVSMPQRLCKWWLFRWWLLTGSTKLGEPFVTFSWSKLNLSVSRMKLSWISTWLSNTCVNKNLEVFTFRVLSLIVNIAEKPVFVGKLPYENSNVGAKNVSWNVDSLIIGLETVYICSSFFASVLKCKGMTWVSGWLRVTWIESCLQKARLFSYVHFT